MGKIQLTPTELLNQSQEMINLKARYEELFQSVDGILNQVNGSWSENLANNFSGKISAARSSFSRVTDMLQAGADAAGGSAASFVSLDRQLSGLFLGGEGKMLTGIGTAMGISEILSQKIQSRVQSTGENSLSKMLEKIEKDRESRPGKLTEGAYDLLDFSLGKDSPLGKVKEGYDVLKDILTGEADWDTAKTGVDLFGGGSRLESVILTGKVIFSEESDYMERHEELQEDMIEHLKEGDILGTGFLMAGDFVETVGKGVIEVGSQLVVSTLHLDTVNNLIEGFTNVDVGEAITNAAEKVGDGISDFVDAGAEVMGDISETMYDLGEGAVKFVGNVFQGAQDILGKIF